MLREIFHQANMCWVFGFNIIFHALGSFGIKSIKGWVKLEKRVCLLLLGNIFYMTCLTMSYQQTKPILSKST